MRKILTAVASFLALSAVVSAADAGVVVKVSKSRQTMYVYVDGYLQRSWPVSTASLGSPAFVFALAAEECLGTTMCRFGQ